MFDQLSAQLNATLQKLTGRGVLTEDAVKEGYDFIVGFRELRNITWVELPTSHWPMWSRPQELTDILADVASAHATEG